MKIMKKEITRRGFLGECGKGIGVGLVGLVLGSCATLDNNQTSKPTINLTEEQRKAYKEYRQKYGRLDESDLTTEQREGLKELNNYLRTEGLDEYEITWLQKDYPFIDITNPNSLPLKDKVFIMEKAYEELESFIEGVASINY